ncbi:MAG: DUF2911 domain-containing protein [Bacteroidota bacterium]
MKNVFPLILLIVLLSLSEEARAQKFDGLDRSPMDMTAYPSSHRESDKAIRIIYSRPQLKGRSLAELAPLGQVWRTGANEAPEITFYKDITFGGQEVAAGTYSLFTIPGENTWTVILNKNLNQWGAYSYDEAQDVTRITVPSSSNSKSLEPFSIAFKKVEDDVHMVMGWDKTRVAVPIDM